MCAPLAPMTCQPFQSVLTEVLKHELRLCAKLIDWSDRWIILKSPGKFLFSVAERWTPTLVVAYYAQIQRVISHSQRRIKRAPVLKNGFVLYREPNVCVCMLFKPCSIYQGIIEAKQRRLAVRVWACDHKCWSGEVICGVVEWCSGFWSRPAVERETAWAVKGLENTLRGFTPRMCTYLVIILLLCL